MRSPVLIALALLLAQGAQAAVVPDAPCQVSASEHSELSALVPGVLAEVLVDRGDKVKKGQVLARLHSEVEQAQLSSAIARAGADALLRSRRAKLAMAERTLVRNKDLQTRNVISDQDYDQLRTDRDIAALDVTAAAEALSQAKAELEIARAALAVREIRSPIDGVVTDRGLNPGERAGEKPVLVVQRLDRLYAEAVLPATLRAGLHVGSQVTLLFDLPGLAPRSAAVALVDPVIDPKTDMFAVRMTLDNADLTLPAGLKCRIDLAAAP
jgi:RND family efflux transporter MFP subunit